MTINQMEIGDGYSFSHTVTEADVANFAGVTTDHNPAHTDEVYASGTMFKHRIAHGMLSAGYISAILGMHFPGPGTIYMGQTLSFVAPVYIGDTVTASVKVKEFKMDKKDPSKRKSVILETTVTKVKAAGDEPVTCIVGEATVMPPRA